MIESSERVLLTTFQVHLKLSKLEWTYYHLKLKSLFKYCICTKEQNKIVSVRFVKNQISNIYVVKGENGLVDASGRNN